jgi:hypothetical protein
MDGSGSLYIQAIGHHGSGAEAGVPGPILP